MTMTTNSTRSSTRSLGPSYHASYWILVVLLVTAAVFLRACVDVTGTKSTFLFSSPPSSSSSSSSSVKTTLPANTESVVGFPFEDWLHLWHIDESQPRENRPLDDDKYYPYASRDEYTMRKSVYQDNLSRWIRLNRIPGEAKYGPETEPYADRTSDEFATIVGSCHRTATTGGDKDTRAGRNLRKNHRSKQPPPTPTHTTTDSRFPSTTTDRQFLLEPFTVMDVDWRSHAPPPNSDSDSPSSQDRLISYVTPVKNQGPHGTCWSFAVAENLEGLAVRQGHALPTISEQEFISCCSECQGRAAAKSFEWLLTNTGGVPALEDGYPYDGNASVPCRADTAPRANVTLHSWSRVIDEDATGGAIVQALEEHGPVGMGVDARCFHGYQSGIVRSCGDGSGGINHAVLMVAAGTDLYYNTNTSSSSSTTTTTTTTTTTAAAARQQQQLLPQNHPEHRAAYALDSSFGHPKERSAIVTNADADADATALLSFPESVDFYTIKNSWGPVWGEDGYVRIERGKDWWGKIVVIYTE